MTASPGLLIFGAGGHGRVVASAARAAGWTTIGFLDPQWPRLRDAGDWPVEGNGDDLSVVAGRAVIVAIGDNARRLALIETLAAAGLDIAAVVHPTAWVCPGVPVGAGAFVSAQAAINHGASLGRGVIVNTGAIVEHDCILADGVHVSPGAVLAGSVEVGGGAWIGAGASVRPGVRIGARAVIGAGAAVVSDVAPGATYAGVPARPLGAGRRKGSGT